MEEEEEIFITRKLKSGTLQFIKVVHIIPETKRTSIVWLFDYSKERVVNNRIRKLPKSTVLKLGHVKK